MLDKRKRLKRLSNKQAELLCAIYNVTERMQCFPTMGMVAKELGRPADRFGYQKDTLVKHGLIKIERTRPFRIILTDHSSAIPVSDNENPPEKGKLNKVLASVLQAIYYLTERDGCYPTCWWLSTVLDQELTLTAKLLVQLEDHQLIRLERGIFGVNIISLRHHSPVTVPGRHLITKDDAEVLRAIYFLTGEKGIATMKEIVNFTDMASGNLYRRIAWFESLGLVKRTKERPTRIIPLLNPPVASVGKVMDLTVSRISASQADIIRAIHYLSLSLGRPPAISLLKSTVTDTMDNFIADLMALQASKTIFLDKTEADSLCYITEGNGCDDIAYPHSALTFQRINRRCAALLNAIHSFSECNGFHPSLDDLNAEDGEAHYSADDITRLCDSEVISCHGDVPRYSIMPSVIPHNAPAVLPKNAVSSWLTGRQLECLMSIREHIITYGISPTWREVNMKFGKSTVKDLEKHGVIFMDKGATSKKMRIAPGIGMDDAVREMPFMTSFHYTVLDTIRHKIFYNVRDRCDSYDDVVSGKFRKKCFTDIATIASLCEVSEKELAKYLFVLRSMGYIMPVRKNRYGLTGEYITLDYP